MPKSCKRFFYARISGWGASNEAEAKFIKNRIRHGAKCNEEGSICLAIKGDRKEEQRMIHRIQTARLLADYDLTILLQATPRGDFAIRTTVSIAIITLLQEMAASKYKPKVTLLVDDPSIGDTWIRLVMSLASQLGLLQNLETCAVTPSIVDLVRNSMDLDYFGFVAHPVNSPDGEKLLHDLIDAIGKNSSIKNLYLKSTEIVSDQAADRLGDAIRANTSIRCLSMSHSYDDTKRSILQSLQNHPSIERLVLTFRTTSISTSADTLADELSKVFASTSCRIQEIELRGELGSPLDLPVDFVSKILGRNASLKVFRLDQTTLSVAGVDALLCNLWKWPNLKTLDLSNNPGVKSWQFDRFFAGQHAGVASTSRLEELILDKRIMHFVNNDHMAPLRAQQQLLEAFPRLHSFGNWELSELWANVRRFRKNVKAFNLAESEIVLPSLLEFLADRNHYRPIFEQIGNVPARWYPYTISFVSRNLLKLDPDTKPIIRRQSEMIYQLIRNNPSILDRNSAA